jgi:hypothetical protein
MFFSCGCVCGGVCGGGGVCVLVGCGVVMVVVMRVVIVVLARDMTCMTDMRFLT